jgi:hypothetical protein
VPHFPRFRALALFGRRPLQRVDSLVMPASENLHRNGPDDRKRTSSLRFLGDVCLAMRAYRKSTSPATEA